MVCLRTAPAFLATTSVLSRVLFPLDWSSRKIPFLQPSAPHVVGHQAVGIWPHGRQVSTRIPRSKSGSIIAILAKVRLDETGSAPLKYRSFVRIPTCQYPLFLWGRN